jgi:DNA polymerase III alpha subunit
MRIKKVDYIGERDVYDIEVPQYHNFVLDCGAIAHNCAHSTSYGIVCYNGAWLKYNYPAYFWLGELTVRMDDQDKLREYLAECSHLILPISITKSHPTEWRIETVDGQEMLRPPLMTIRGCGEASVQNIKRFMDASTPDDLKNLAAVDEDKEEVETKKEQEEKEDE